MEGIGDAEAVKRLQESVRRMMERIQNVQALPSGSLLCLPVMWDVDRVPSDTLRTHVLVPFESGGHSPRKSPAVRHRRFLTVDEPKQSYELRNGRLVPMPKGERPRPERGSVVFALRTVFRSSTQTLYAALLHQPLVGFSDGSGSEISSSGGVPDEDTAAAGEHSPFGLKPTFVASELTSFDEDPLYLASVLEDVRLSDPRTSVRSVLDLHVARFLQEYDRQFRNMDEDSAEASIQWAHSRMRRLCVRLLAEAVLPAHARGGKAQLLSYVESYFSRRVYSRLMYSVSIRHRHEDNELEARIFRYSRTPLDVWGVQPELGPSVDQAAQILRALPRCQTPLGKLRVLRKAATVAVSDKCLLGSDDLLPVLISMVIRGCANLGLASQLHFAQHFYLADDIVFSDLGFLLTSFQAAYRYLLHDDAESAVRSLLSSNVASSGYSSAASLPSASMSISPSSSLASSMQDLKISATQWSQVEEMGSLSQRKLELNLSPSEWQPSTSHGLITHSPSLDHLILGEAKVEGSGGAQLVHVGEDCERVAVWGTICAELYTEPMTWTLPAVTQVAAGERHALILTRGGALYSVGAGGEGALGHGDAQDRPTPMLVHCLLRQRITHVSAGGRHSLAVDEAGVLLSWGWGEFGQLGYGNRVNAYSPSEVALPASDRVVEVAAGGCHSLCRTSSGAVFAWGRAAEGRIGVPGLLEDQLFPVSLSDLPEPAKQVCAGWAHSVVRTESGAVFGFGRNGEGQLGLGTDIAECKVPTRLPVVCAEAVYVGFHNTVVVDQGRVLAFGLGESGQLGAAMKRYDQPEELPLPSSEDALEDMSFGVSHSLLRMRSGRAYCLGGDNRNGQLANFLLACSNPSFANLAASSLANAPLPLAPDYYNVVVPGVSRFRNVACGFWFSIVVCESGHDV